MNFFKHVKSNRIFDEGCITDFGVGHALFLIGAANP